MNWVELIRHSPKIEMHGLTLPEQLSNVYLPWYRTDAEIDVSFGAEGSRPISALEAARDFNQFSIERRDGINFYVEKYQNSSLEALRVPAYQLPLNRRLLLDGNHRTVALAALNRPFHLVLATIVAPIDAVILPDLACWQEN